MMTLPAIIRDGGALRATIGDEWLQGRTAYGGVSAAIALAAAKMAHGDLPPLRSAQIAFVGPLSGSVVAEPVLLRRGKNSAFIGCDLIGADGIGLRALLLFMAPRASGIEYTGIPSATIPGPETPILDGASIGLNFLANFEFMQCPDQPPGHWRRWARIKARVGLDPEVELLTIADALPPAAMTLAKRWGPISTTTWQLNLLTDAPGTADGWWLLEAITLAAHDGASSQTMTIWNHDGDAVATATQSVALFV
jgi:acyl-CoA thioesterase